MKSSQNNNTDFIKTLITLVAMVVISGLAWLGIRHFQTDITPVAKPAPKTNTMEKPHE